MRTILVLVAMVAAGLGFGRLTSGQGVVVEKVKDGGGEEHVREGIPAKVRLVFSGVTGFWELKSGGVRVDLKRSGDGAVGETVRG
jgi:hypothetical protein